MARIDLAAMTLDRGWELAETVGGGASRPSAVDAKWRAAQVPGTVAAALGVTFDAPRELDVPDFWFRKRVAAGEVGDVLRFEGLATLADVWIDDEHVLRSENMFVEHEIDAKGRVRDGCEIAIRFSSLAQALAHKRPRPRWRSTVVCEQQLRWLRTSLLGRIPAWTPPVPPVGPYRRITIGAVSPAVADVRARVVGDDGVVDARLDLCADVASAELRVGEVSAPLSVAGHLAHGSLVIPHVARWWPHTHGVPVRYPVSVVLKTHTHERVLRLGATGFRSIAVDRDDGAFTLYVNGVRVFCRGAAWMPLDVVSLQATREALRAQLEQVRAAGMNMLRISGTMLYESQDFHDLCDELGILVWQDFMFANMDYPTADAAFTATVREEASQLLDRLQLSPSLVVCCGGSEVEQQAAMMGLPAGEWSNELFRKLLPSVVGAARTDVVYVPSSPTGGALPFHVDTGVAHYYGVGAYLRPFDDARRARVRFTSECLAFANLPGNEAIDELLGDGAAPTQHPRWKSRVARDRGTAWDFDDVRDHYVKRIFDVDPAALRQVDLPRYLELGRVATGEAMASAMTEWRRTRSECSGALVWFLRDLWQGAGWGLIDAHGMPKSPYYYLRRVLAPVALLVTDEGLNGLSLHAVNDRNESIAAELSITLYRGEAVVAQGSRPMTLEPRSVTEVKADALLGRFTDMVHAYRFGPRGHDVTVATLVRAGTILGRAFHFPGGLRDERVADLGVEASAERIAEGAWRVVIRTRKALQAVAFEARGLVAADDFFHVAPGDVHETVLTSETGKAVASLSASIKPLNGTSSTRVICTR